MFHVEHLCALNIRTKFPEAVLWPVNELNCGCFRANSCIFGHFFKRRFFGRYMRNILWKSYPLSLFLRRFSDVSYGTRLDACSAYFFRAGFFYRHSSANIQEAIPVPNRVDRFLLRLSYAPISSHGSNRYDLTLCGSLRTRARGVIHKFRCSACLHSFLFINDNIFSFKCNILTFFSVLCVFS